MATFMTNDVSLVFNSVDLSDHLESAEIPEVADMLEDTAMGDTWRSFIAGLKSWTLRLTFHQDFAASEVWATINSLGGVGSSATAVLKPTSGAVAATNPSFTGTVFVTENVPVVGNVGDLAKLSVTWQGSGALTVATS